MTQVDGLKVRMPQFSGDWEALEVEAAWRLGQWDRLADAPDPDAVNLDALVSGTMGTLSRGSRGSTRVARTQGRPWGRSQRSWACFLGREGTTGWGTTWARQ